MNIEEKWIIGEPLLKSYFTMVDLEFQTISFTEVSIIELKDPSAFETLLGWIVLISLIIGSLVLYLVSVGLYHLIKHWMQEKNDISYIDAKYERLYALSKQKK